MATEPPNQPAPSLASRLSGWRSGPVGARAALLVGVLLAAAPVASLVGAKLLAMRAVDDRVSLERAHASGFALARSAAVQRRDLSVAFASTGVAGTLETLARTLPGDAMLISVSRGRDGRLALDVATNDPDRLRVALRRAPDTAGLRDAGQRQGDGGLIVTLADP